MDFTKEVAEAAKKVKLPKEVEQHILWAKSIYSKALEDAKVEGCYTFSNARPYGHPNHKFGFSEREVNFLMQMVYDKARLDNLAQYNKGYAQCKADALYAIEHVGEEDGGW